MHGKPEANPRNHPISCNRVGVLESLSIIWPFRPIIRDIPAATLSLPPGTVFPPFSFHERRPAGSCDTRQCRSLFRLVLFPPKGSFPACIPAAFFNSSNFYAIEFYALEYPRACIFSSLLPIVLCI